MSKCLLSLACHNLSKFFNRACVSCRKFLNQCKQFFPSQLGPEQVSQSEQTILSVSFLWAQSSIAARDLTRASHWSKSLQSSTFFTGASFLTRASYFTSASLYRSMSLNQSSKAIFTSDTISCNFSNCGKFLLEQFSPDQVCYQSLFLSVQVSLISARGLCRASLHRSKSLNSSTICFPASLHRRCSSAQVLQ